MTPTEPAALDAPTIEALRILAGGTHGTDASLDAIAESHAQQFVDAGLLCDTYSNSLIRPLTDAGRDVLAAHREGNPVGADGQQHRPVTDDDGMATACATCARTHWYPCAQLVAHWPDMPLRPSGFDLYELMMAAGDAQEGLYERLKDEVGEDAAAKMWRVACAEIDHDAEISTKRDELDQALAHAATALGDALTARATLDTLGDPEHEDGANTPFGRKIATAADLVAEAIEITKRIHS